MAERVCIIGAGPSGTAQLRAFAAAEKQGLGTPEVVCFEKQNACGGLWNWDPREGTDEFGEPVHNSMYRYLWSNGPKECLEFADYTFMEHFKEPMGSYPPRAVLHDYVKGRLEKSGVDKLVRFNTAVRDVRFDEETQKFTVTVYNLTENKEYSEVFDYVVVASGHFSTPSVPRFDGMHTFQGRVLHAHDFRDAVNFKDQDVLCIGGSYSAEDIASQCYKYGCKSVTISYRSKPLGFHWPANVREVPEIKSIDGDTCTFVDGSTARVDAMIMCTGYKHSFRFLPEELTLKTPNVLFPLNLYKGVVFEPNRKIMYLGMQDQFYTFNMFDAQAWYVRDVILGKIQLPATREEMAADSKVWADRQDTLKSDRDMIWFQGDYVKDLLKETDYPMTDEQVEKVNNMFMVWEGHKHEDIMTFRDQYGFPSPWDGTKSVAHHTKWLDALDDSLASFLGTATNGQSRSG